MFLSQPVISDVDILPLLQLAGELLVGVGVVQLEAAGFVQSPTLGQQLDEEDADGGDERGGAGGDLDPLNLAARYLDLPPPLLRRPLGGGAGRSI